MELKILGGGCKNCQKLYQNTMDAISEMQIQADVIKVTDYVEIAKYRIMKTPALVCNENVLVYGRVPSKEEIIDLLRS